MENHNQEKTDAPETMQSIRRHFRAVQRELDAAQGIPAAPFSVGDVVMLKSGGFAMTVADVRLTCAPARHLVDVTWSAHHCERSSQLGAETFEADMLRIATLDELRRLKERFEAAGDIPF